MNFKTILFFSLGLMAMPVAFAQGPPECIVGVDTEECDVPLLGEKGFFVCRPRPGFRGADGDETRPPRDMDHTRPPFMDGEGRGRGPGGRRGPPLSRARCVPTQRPEEAPTRPPRPEGAPTRPPVECGCCGDICPLPLNCGCSCDLRLRRDEDGDGIDDILPGAGMLVTILGRDGGFREKCVPAGSYADPDRVQCVDTCGGIP